MRFATKKPNKSGALQEVSEKKPQLGLPQMPQGADIYSHDLAVLVLNEEADVLDEEDDILKGSCLSDLAVQVGQDWVKRACIHTYVCLA